MTHMPTPKPSTRRCPICGQPTAVSARPFCSTRCRDIDLSRWFRGSYAIPVEDPLDEDELEGLAQQAEADQAASDSGDREDDGER